MLKQIFFNGLVSGVLAIIASLVYTNGYFSILVDFSEGVTVPSIILNCLMVAMGASLLYMLLAKIFKNLIIADFIFNLLFAVASLGMVFYVLNSPDPEFKNEDAALFIDYYKGFIMPMLFFPALGWMIAKPLLIKNND